MAASLLPPSPPAEKASATQDRNHSGKASTDDGRGHSSGDRRIVVSLKAAARIARKSATHHKLSDSLSRVGMNVKIVGVPQVEARE